MFIQVISTKFLPLFYPFSGNYCEFDLPYQAVVAKVKPLKLTYKNQLTCLFCFVMLFFIAAKRAMEGAMNPLIIDNTNTQAWEMRPYVALVSSDRYMFIYSRPDVHGILSRMPTKLRKWKNKKVIC